MLEPRGGDPAGSAPLGLFEDLLDMASAAPATPATPTPNVTGAFFGQISKYIGYRRLAWGEEDEEGMMQ